MLVLHGPNDSPKERAKFFEVHEGGNEDVRRTEAGDGDEQLRDTTRTARWGDLPVCNNATATSPQNGQRGRSGSSGPLVRMCSSNFRISAASSALRFNVKLGA